ncbi:hypothetical protein [Actinotalea solisilvae]|uniref:hypothetical protein n=1 Tax=Actinotalea solisilvae TaxID=2072922 RepID=UPI0018F1E034|nr:hypothetical protein [Actinotalea solisilvae]
MAQGFEVDWDLLGRAGSSLLHTADDVVPGLGAPLRGRTGYGDPALAGAAALLGEAMHHQAVGLAQALAGLGDGLRASARSYSEADALAAVHRVEMFG